MSRKVLHEVGPRSGGVGAIRGQLQAEAGRQLFYWKVTFYHVQSANINKRRASVDEILCTTYQYSRERIQAIEGSLRMAQHRIPRRGGKGVGLAGRLPVTAKFYPC
jgi:hypothetical protein